MKDINDILAKHFSSTSLSVEEQSILNKWIEENNAEYESLSKSWQSVPEFKYHEFDTESALQKVNSKLKESQSTKIFTLKPILKYAIAASVALILAVGGFNLFKSSNNNAFIAFENHTDEVKTLKLEDGSVITVGKQTTVKYQSNFANNRNVKLEGEAFFEVFRDEQHPFVISTEYGEIEVLGTSFNINTKHQQTEVSVKTGRVELRNSTDKVILVKNEFAISDGKHITNKTKVDANFLAWKTGKFIFNDKPINKVVNDLNNYYNTKIVLDKNVDVNQTFTGTFDHQKIEDIVEAITLSCNLEFEKNDNQIIIK